MTRPTARIWMSIALSVVLGACAGVKPQASAASGGTGGAAPGTGGSPGAGGAASGGSRAIGSGGTTVSGNCSSNLECQQTTCMIGSCSEPACSELEAPKTTLSGTIYDPAGKVPLYNVSVYVPNQPLAPISEGLSCDQCNGRASGQPIASALTDAAGHFTIDNPPVGKNIPLVIQIGKWRRQVVIPEIARCTDTKITDVELERLPRNQSEGHLPLIALTTGHSDALECLLRKIGISDSEFTSDGGGGRVHLYYGGGDLSNPSGSGAGVSALASGAKLAGASALWGSRSKLASYDIMMLSCEGSQYGSVKDPYLANVQWFADNGGRIFDDHLHFYWIQHGLPPWPATADWVGVQPDLGDITGQVDTSFAKGQSLADWLVNVGASTTKGQLPIVMAQHSVTADVAPVSQQWIYTPSPAQSVQYLTFNTPAAAPAAGQCGRVVFTDIHVSAASGDSSHPETPFPGGCTSTALSPQEKALEFMFFDLSSCVQNDFDQPLPPIIVP
ncbi:MAG TPA: carboxypeptidase-like regulatory domain-containing protein [Polyangia bacterium]|nr:carboxypeptidase-like regulatory domain-containing protein [Polyangia bacterium]